MQRLTIFWILMAAGTALFLAGCVANLSIWLSGRVESAPKQSKPAKLRALLRLSARTVFSPQFGSAAKALVLDGLLHRSLFRTDKLRWLSHSLLSLGFLALFVLTTFTGFFEEILHRALGVESPFVLAVVNKDTPVMAVLNEALGLFLIVGLAALAFRRYVSRPPQLRTSRDDTAVIVLLAVGLVTAYPTEALRFLVENTPPSVGQYSFVGYALAQWMKPLGLPWAQWHFVLFFVHVVPLVVLLVFMPWSKFFHVAVSPIVAAANSMREGETR